MMRSLLTGAAVVTTVLALAACQNEKEDPAPTSQPAMGMLNSTCPMSDEPVDPNAKTVEYHGYKIGFCCDMCVGGWEKQSDAEKQASIAKYTK